MPRDDASDEKTGNDEEYIDSDEATRKIRRKGVVPDDEPDRHRAKAIDIATISRHCLVEPGGRLFNDRQGVSFVRGRNPAESPSRSYQDNW